MPSATLIHINPQDFLADYWQQKPLLVRESFSSEELISQEELMALACEPEAESRLISNSADQPNDWQVQHGPFTEKDYQSLPDSHWTLLVQAVDHWIEAVNDSFSAFQFLPRWRMDDMMISFAVEGGGVGPHYDQYDVFLIQLSGKRHWKVGQHCNENSELLEDLPVKVLQEFEQQESWITEPGDLLYIPPGVAHWSESIGDSLTLSVGFRAPSDSEFITEFGYFLSDQLSEFQRYQDPKLSQRNANPHALLSEDIQRLKAIIERNSSDEQLAQWLGQYMTQPKYNEAEPFDDLDFESFMAQWHQQPLYKNPTSRFAYYGSALFADGHRFDSQLEAQDLEVICSTAVFESDNKSPFDQIESHTLLFQLFIYGVLFFDQD